MGYRIVIEEDGSDAIPGHVEWQGVDLPLRSVEFNIPVGRSIEIRLVLFTPEPFYWTVVDRDDGPAPGVVKQKERIAPPVQRMLPGPREVIDAEFIDEE